MTEENYENNSNGSYPFEFDSTESVENTAHQEQPKEQVQEQPQPQAQVQTPPVESQSQRSVQTESASQNDDSKKKGTDFRNSVSDYAVSMYTYAAGVKNKGHVSLADLMLKDLMTILMSTNTASDAIGREKFTEMLENGYYASSRMIEYMKFLNSMNIRNIMYEPLLEENERIHKVFSASLRTTRAKSRSSVVGM